MSYKFVTRVGLFDVKRQESWIILQRRVFTECLQLLLKEINPDLILLDIRRALEAGFHSYISKPFDAGLFLETIDKVFKEEMDRQ